MSQKKKRKKSKVSYGSKRTRRKTIPSGKSRLNMDNKLLTAINYHRAGQLQKAQEIYERILQTYPNHSESLYLLGAVNHQVGNTDTAVDLYNKALQNDPDNPTYHNSLGDAFLGQGKLDEAVSCYQKALQLKPDLAAAHNNMGNAFNDQGKLNDAISCYEKALQLRPDWAGTRYNMGNVFENLGKSDEAIASYQKAVEIQPDYAEAYNSLGNAFQDQGKLNEAISCYRKALRLKPNYAEAYNGMGSAFDDLDDLGEAISCFQEAVRLKSNLADAYVHLAHLLRQTCDWQKLEGPTAKLQDLTKKAIDKGTRIGESPFISITTHDDISRNFAIAMLWSNDIARTMSNLKVHFSFDDRTSRKSRIAVGYLSNDFCDHATAHLILSLFGLHNRDEFEVFCYSYGEDDGSYYRKRIQRDCDKFVDLGNLSHADAARCIFEDQVDILVDLKGYTKGSRLQICALRPAPVQVSYLGFPGTTGADFFDYILTDRIVTPEDHAPYYRENFVYLPHCYQVNDHTQPISETNSKREDFGLPGGSFLFCSFNHPYKIDPLMFDIWMKILGRVPEGVLWLSRANEAAEKNLKREAEVRGQKSDRLIFGKNLPKDQHLARLRLADLALDTRICNGHTTTSDALWVGVPVITLQGNHFASRVSASILTAIGLPELIAHSLEDYETLAVRYARHPSELQAIRHRLAKNRLTQPLFDTLPFVRNLETAYKEMWKIYSTGEAPRQIQVMENQ